MQNTLFPLSCLDYELVIHEPMRGPDRILPLAAAGCGEPRACTSRRAAGLGGLGRCWGWAAALVSVQRVRNHSQIFLPGFSKPLRVTKLCSGETHAACLQTCLHGYRQSEREDLSVAAVDSTCLLTGIMRCEETCLHQLSVAQISSGLVVS